MQEARNNTRKELLHWTSLHRATYPRPATKLFFESREPGMSVNKNYGHDQGSITIKKV